jgi:glycosyltransferase involved in cell wall biosynthesis
MAVSITAIVTAFNSERFISEAIASIRAQTSPPDEIVVVDDGSTDRTGEIVAELGSDIRYHWQENQGEGAARNRGVALARSDFIAFLDADDAWPLMRTAAMRHCLQAGPPADIVCGRFRYFRNETWQAALLPASARPEMTMLVFGCALIRRGVFDRVGPVGEKMRIGCDLDWYLRSIEIGICPKLLNEVTLLYRRHDDNVTKDVREVRAALAMVLKRSLDRRRRSGRAHSLPAWVTEPQAG